MSESVSFENTTCPLCGDAKSQPVLIASDRLYGSAGEFTVVRCDACQHTFLNPRPTRECIGQFYPTDYGPFRGATSGELGVGSGERRELHIQTTRSVFNLRSWSWLRRLVLWWIESRAAPILLSPLPTPHSPLALELGCSHGSFLQQLRDLGWECVGIEPADDVARRATERGFDVRTGSLEEAVAADRMTFAPGRFDAVFAWMVIEHLHDPVATLRLARELLKPGGVLSFSVPNFGCWERRAFGQYWYALQLPTHLQHFTSDSLRRLLSASGFELVEQIHQRNVNNLVGSLGLWLRTKFPRWPLGERLIRWTDNPSAFGLCLLAPLSRLLAILRQSGRLTIVARTNWESAVMDRPKMENEN